MGEYEKGASMPSEVVRDAAPEQGRRTTVGTVNVVDPHPLDWFY
jgi:hypothetical protein